MAAKDHWSIRKPLFFLNIASFHAMIKTIQIKGRDMTMIYAKKLVLIGFMGTGKSSVANRLSEVLQIPVVDVDTHIVESAGQSIPELFEHYGEQHFRDLETSSLQTILTSVDASIVATGGGAVLKQENQSLMLEHGIVFALTATPEVIIERVKHDTNRPLLQGEVEKRVYELLEKRKDSYRFAHYTIDTTNLSLDEVVESICVQWTRTANK